jgi:hypothetical protein
MAEFSRPVLLIVYVILFLLLIYFLYNYYIEYSQYSRPKTIMAMILIPAHAPDYGETGKIGYN